MTGREEQDRVTELKGYGVLDTPNEPEFDAIVREAARDLHSPIALISFIDETRSWFKAKVGLDASETPRSISFCTHLLRGPEALVVEDLSADPRFADNPLVAQAPSARFYAGVPLATSTGRRIGTLCVLDFEPHRFTSKHETRVLAALAAKTMKAMEARKARQLTPRPEAGEAVI